MTTDREDPRPDWQRVKEIVADALECKPCDRAAHLDRACAGDPSLRAEVESLLPEEETTFLERPAVTFFEVPAPAIGSRLGKYTLQSVIGEGAMGRVYEATQDHPRRTVALKVLRPGLLVPHAERRFQWEVEALGRMNHPSIAKVHDAGVERLPSGHAVSWFAMERIAGRPLLEAADRARLDRTARLRLFHAVCQGVAHAHRRGILHRDLKPENILVDDELNPHIVDFGIARAVDAAQSTLTTKGEIVGTLAYMSPEQVLGEPEQVDVRSDVHALGVILYRLLTGVPPLDLGGLSVPKAIARITQGEKPLASTHDRTLRGDLDTVLETAMARDPVRRYASVDALAEDIAHVLSNEPIQARPQTTWYQLRKFARRHRALVAGTTITFLALVVAVVGTSIGFLRAEQARATAERERSRAELERDRTQAVNRFLDQLLASASPDLDGRDVRVVDLLRKATANMRNDSTLDPAVSARLHLTLGSTYQQLGFIEPAHEHFLAARDTFRRLDGKDSADALEATAALCEAHLASGRFDEARALWTEVRDAVERRASSPDWLTLRPRELEAEIASAEGDLTRCVELYQELFDAWRAREPEGHDTTETARNNLAWALLENGRGAEAATLLERGVEVRARVMGDDHSDVLLMRGNLASALAETGRRLEALAQYERLLPRATEIWGRDHPNVLSLRTSHAGVLESLGRQEEARALYEDILDLTLETFGHTHRRTAVARNNLAVTLAGLEQWAAAETILRRSLDALSDGASEADAILVLRTRMSLASAIQGQKRDAEARAMWVEILAGLEEQLGESHLQTLTARNNLAMLVMDMGDFEDAIRLARHNLDLARRDHPSLPYNVFPFQMNHGRALAAAGRFDLATSELLAVERHLRDDPDSTAQYARICEVLSQTYAAWGNEQERLRWERAIKR